MIGQSKSHARTISFSIQICSLLLLLLFNLRLEVSVFLLLLSFGVFSLSILLPCCFEILKSKKLLSKIYKHFLVSDSVSKGFLDGSFRSMQISFNFVLHTALVVVVVHLLEGKNRFKQRVKQEFEARVKT